MSELSSSSDALEIFAEADRRMQELAASLTQLVGLQSVFRPEIFQDAELTLSPGAYLLLAIPLIEAGKFRAIAQVGRESMDPQIYASLNLPTEFAPQTVRQLVEEIASNPAEADRALNILPRQGNQRIRTSLSVIKGFWKRFCNIPPFCGER